jgi:hypothetical protein
MSYFTFPPPATLSATITSATHGELSNNTSVPTSTLMGTINGLANAVAPAWTEGKMVLLSVDLVGNLRTTNPSQLPAALGQTTMAASLPVVLASNQSALPVSQSGVFNITNVSGTVSLPTGAATDATVATLFTDAHGQTLSGKLNPLTRDPVSSDSALAVRSIRAQRELNSTGGLVVGEPTPLVAVEFNYSINSRVVTTTLNTTGTATQANALAVLQTGTGVAGSAKLESKTPARYVGGTGLFASWTALFTTGVANSQQEIGIGDDNDGFFFAYVGSTFGVLHRLGGSDADFIPQASWNGDKFDGTGPSGVVLDKTKLNIFKVQFLYHGAGPIIFLISDGVRYQVCHTISYANLHTVPHLSNPTLPLHMKVINSGNATNLTLKSASCGIYAEGKSGTIFPPVIGLTGSVNNAKSGVTTETSVVTVQNKASNVYGATNTNRVRIQLTAANFSSTSGGASPVKFRLVRNTTLGGAPSYTDYDTNTSVVSSDVAGTTLTGGLEDYSTTINGQTNTQIDLTSFGIVLNPGDIETLAVSGSNIQGFASIQWIELN